MKYPIPSDTTVLQALKVLYPDSSRRTLQNWLKNGRFFVDEKPVDREQTPLQKGQILSVKETFKPPKVPGLNIIYDDRHMIVIDKPKGLLSVPLDEVGVKKDALTLLKDHYQTDQIFAVHRIDRDTSGILLFAKGKASEEYFDHLFEQHEILREYYAVVEGRMKEEKGTWQSKLLELPSFDVIESSEGKDAITHFEVIRRSAKYTYLKLRLETGRKHQIRVHCQMHGHPITGDFRYGALQNPIKRLCLHACTLGFIHPFSKKEVKFESPLPHIFKALGATKK